MQSSDFNSYKSSIEVIKNSSEAAAFIPAKDKADLFGSNHIFKTCAYCRVSTDHDEQLSSFELQQEHYRHLVSHHPNWDLKHIFVEDRKSTRLNSSHAT